ncbi:GNAT family N-acetyltransferase [Piscibacillus halophilus]|uniref:GNAT family N-acetyltransferase n=2 Tax=Piscibacillus halophilus TaxID=571933 RepID=UPI001FE64964|nr:GNAT family N-acetyltransferase [Piscibacillus halophilus]
MRKGEQMKLESERLTLVPCTKDVVLSRKFDTPPHIKTYLENLEQDPELLGWGVWIVLDKQSNKIVGDMGFKGKPKNHTVEIGYGILPGEQGKGFATEGVTELINWAFSFDDVHKIQAECHADNKASIRVLEKVHMKVMDQSTSFIYWELDKEEN